MRRFFLAALAAAVFAFAPPQVRQAEATPKVALGLAIDGSGSIPGADFTLQVQGYVNALTSLLTTDGYAAIGVWQFSNVVQQVFPMTVIDDAGDKAALLAAISGMVQIGSLTAIGDAINVATAALLPFVTSRQLIDVSTDGSGNIGANQVTAATNALAAGIEQINCLGVGPGATCNFDMGAGSFEILAPNFAAFQTAIDYKLERELTVVPEPATLALLGVGLLALGLVRRRRAYQPTHLAA